MIAIRRLSFPISTLNNLEALSEIVGDVIVAHNRTVEMVNFLLQKHPRLADELESKFIGFGYDRVPNELSFELDTIGRAMRHIDFDEPVPVTNTHGGWASLDEKKDDMLSRVQYPDTSGGAFSDAEIRQARDAKEGR